MCFNGIHSKRYFKRNWWVINVPFYNSSFTGNWCEIDVPLNEQNVSSNDAIIWKKIFLSPIHMNWTRRNKATGRIIDLTRIRTHEWRTTREELKRFTTMLPRRSGKISEFFNFYTTNKIDQSTNTLFKICQRFTRDVLGKK